MNIRHPPTGYLTFTFYQNIFYDKTDLRLFIFMCNVHSIHVPCPGGLPSTEYWNEMIQIGIMIENRWIISTKNFCSKFHMDQSSRNIT